MPRSLCCRSRARLAASRPSCSESRRKTPASEAVNKMHDPKNALAKSTIGRGSATGRGAFIFGGLGKTRSRSFCLEHFRFHFFGAESCRSHWILEDGDCYEVLK